MTRANRLLFRVVVGFWLFGWYCNGPGTPGFIHNFVEGLSYALDYAPFPALLQGPRSVLAIYFAPLAVLVALASPTLLLARSASALMLVASFAACIHLETCNDATFVTSFWAAAWLCWLSWNGQRDDDKFVAMARGLAHGVVGLMFLGGLVGKLTPEYRSGEAFFRLYFRDNGAWPYPDLRASMTPEGFRGLANWFSRAAIFGETMMAVSPFLPTRVSLVIGGITILGMMTAWTFHLWSVLSCLFGLLVAAELLRRRASSA